MNKNKSFPTPTSKSEFFALEEPRKSFEKNKSNKRIAVAAAIIGSGAALGTLHVVDNDVAEPLFAGFMGAAVAVNGKKALDARKEEGQALSQAHEVAALYHPEENIVEYVIPGPKEDKSA